MVVFLLLLSCLLGALILSPLCAVYNVGVGGYVAGAYIPCFRERSLAVAMFNHSCTYFIVSQSRWLVETKTCLDRDNTHRSLLFFDTCFFYSIIVPTMLTSRVIPSTILSSIVSLAVTIVTRS